MNKKAQIILPAVALCVTAIGIGAYNVYASETGQPVSLIAKIAQKFNINENDVQKVFAQERQEREKEMQMRYENMLSDAVKNGKITEAQKKLLLAKHAEMKDEREKNREAHKNLSEQEREKMREARRADIEARHAELESWAKENGIDMTYLMFGREHGLHGNFGGKM